MSRRPAIFAPWPAIAMFITTAMADDSTIKAVCRYTTDCEGGNHECIDSRCMCNPAWAHTGENCDQPSWSSWAQVVVLATVGTLSVLVLASAAKRLSSSPSRCGSGMVQLASMLFKRQQEEDSGTTTVRVVLVSVIVDIIHYAWKMLTAVGVISDLTSAYWQARILFPLSEGLLVLPAAIVVSVWMDVANSSMSRTKSKKKLERTKRVLEVGTGLYTVLLLLMSVFGQKDLAMVVQLGAIGVGLTACGSGAAKLCNTLRALGASSASIADTVFKVSRSMGISLYIIFIGNTMVLSSRTRKSNPANLALLGALVSSSAKCFLNKAIFEYMVESTRAKKARQIASANFKNSPFKTLKPAVRLVSSLHSIRKAKIRRIAVEQQEKGGGPANDHSLATNSSTNINTVSEYTYPAALPPIKNSTGGEKGLPPIKKCTGGEKGFPPIKNGTGDAGASEVKIDSDEVKPFKANDSTFHESDGELGRLGDGHIGLARPPER